MAADAHPSAKLYVKVAVWLAVITAIEVLLSYMTMPTLIAIFALVAAAIVKFTVVVAYFMHLKFDNPTLRMPFLTGIILALSIYTIVVANLVLHAKPPT